jgi:hypothetical protein
VKQLFILGLRLLGISSEEVQDLILTLDHSTFLMDGSNHSYHLALHCFGVFLTRSDEIRAHC